MDRNAITESLSHFPHSDKVRRGDIERDWVANRKEVLRLPRAAADTKVFPAIRSVIDTFALKASNKSIGTVCPRSRGAKACYEIHAR